MTRTRARILAGLFVIGLVVPGAFFMQPPRAHAQWATVTVGGLGTIQQTISAVANVAQEVSQYMLVIDKYVLEPLAFIESGNLVKAITAGVLKYVAGQTNGTGIQQFVQNLRGLQRDVGTVQALAFIGEFNKYSNSPFASAISASLAQNYLQQTSLRGFFASNQCTLGSVSPNIQQFLAGNWSQGGAAAWLALSTNNQNNPYMLHAAAQAELSKLVVDATAAKLTELGWSNGFLSWCGPQDLGAQTQAGATQSALVAATAVPPDVSGGSASNGNCPSGSTNDGGVCYTCASGYSYSGGGFCKPTSSAVSGAGASCTNADGTPGTVETPGSVISNELNKALGLNWDKVVAFGNQVGPEINSILGSIAQVMNTVNFATQVLGGGSSSGGLAGVATPSSSGAQSALDQYANQDGYLGATQASVNQGAVSQSSISDFVNRVNSYEQDWTTIRAAAVTASSSLAQLASSCSMQANAAQTASINEVQPVLTQANQASTAIANARAMIARVQAESTATTPGSTGALTADLQALQTMPPTASDYATAQQNASVLTMATSTPPGSLTVSSGSTVDQMNLIAKNANALKNACIAYATH